jgi:hypothetical protein
MATPKKIHFSKIDRFHLNKVTNRESKEGKYIKSGDDNKFPQKLIELYNESSIHNSCVKAITEAVIGGGLTANQDFFLDKANRKETWNDIFSKVVIDFYLHGSFALEIIWSKDRSRIAEAYHIDFSHVRAEEKDYRGEIPGWYISSDWGKYGSINKDRKDILHLPSFNPDTNLDEPNQLFVLDSYAPGQEVYPLPVYVGALKTIALDISVDTFHLSNIANGLAPSMMITTFTGGSDDDVQAVEQMLRANYGGPTNAGALMHIDCDSPENAPKIEPIPQNGADGYYNTINETVTQKILTAHRITSPLLIGIQQPGSLGNRNEMIDAFLLFQHNVVEPIQQDVIKPLEYLLEFNHPNITLGVKTSMLFEDGETQEEVVTSVEATDVEDSAIQTEEII